MCNFIDANGECWYIRWRHENVTSRVTGQPTTQTTCYLEKGRNPKAADEELRANGILFAATVVKSVKDEANKDKARKVSLSKVLHHRFPGDENKHVRQAAWVGYFHRNEPTVQAVAFK